MTQVVGVRVPPPAPRQAHAKQVGGPLKVETVASSKNPVAGITAAYAGLMDVLKAAA